MAAPRRYYSPNYRFTSSLSSGLKNMKSLEDQEMKFKWNTNQISNQDYLGYVDKRGKEATSQSDSIKWATTRDSVEREIRSDFRGIEMLRISAIPGNTSNTIRQKAETYWKIAEMAYNDGDEDAYVSAMTQFNNAKESYLNKLESEAKAGASAAKKRYTKEIKAEQDLILSREQDAKELLKDHPMELTVALANINIDKANNSRRWAALESSNDNELGANDKELAARKYAQRAQDLAEKFEFTMGPDGYLEPVKVTRPDGVEEIKAANGWQKVYSPDGMKLVNGDRAVKLGVDANGEMTLQEANGFDKNKLVEMTDEDTGETYFSEMQYANVGDKNYALPDNSFGGATKRMFSKQPNDMRYVKDQYGNTMRYNSATNKFDIPHIKGMEGMNTAYGYNVLNTISRPRQNSYLSDWMQIAKRNTALKEAELAKMQEAARPVLNYNALGGATYLPGKGAGAPLKMPAISARETNAGNIVGTPQFGQRFGLPVPEQGPGDLMGYSNGTPYYRVSKADGGFDFVKGNGFKLSVADMAKELNGNANNYLNKNWKF